MAAENTKKLADHYAGRHTLADDELFVVRWSRYLAAADAGTLPFKFSELRTIEQHRQQR